MIFLKEITEWKSNIQNHTYIFKDKKSIKVIGYIKDGEEKPIMFTKPMSFNKRYRKFKEVKCSF